MFIKESISYLKIRQRYTIENDVGIAEQIDSAKTLQNLSGKSSPNSSVVQPSERGYRESSL